MNKISLKYACIDRMPEVIKKCVDDDAKCLINELHDLIIYQINTIKHQRLEIISLKHKEAWKRYDKDINPPDSNMKDN